MSLNIQPIRLLKFIVNTKILIEQLQQKQWSIADKKQSMQKNMKAK